MSTVINFKVDKDLRDQAKQAAQEVGLPLGTIMTHYLKDFVREKRVVFSAHLEPNKATQTRWDSILQDVKAGKHIERFDSVSGAVDWLKK